MNFKEISFAAVVLLVIVALGTWLGTPRTTTKLGDTYSGYPLYVATNSSSTLGTQKSTQVLAADTARMYAMVCNDTTSPSAVAFLSLQATATPDTGIRLAPASCYELLPGNVFTGQVNGYSSATLTLTTITSP